MSLGTIDHGFSPFLSAPARFAPRPGILANGGAPIHHPSPLRTPQNPRRSGLGIGVCFGVKVEIAALFAHPLRDDTPTNHPAKHDAAETHGKDGF